MQPSPYFIRPQRQAAAAGPAVEEAEFFESSGTEWATQLRQYLLAVRKRSWLVVAVALATVVLTALWVLTQTPVFTAEATVMLQQRVPVVMFGNVGAVASSEQGPAGADFIKTECGILTSRTLASQVIRGLGLENIPAFAGKQMPGLTLGTLLGSLRARIGRMTGTPAVKIEQTEADTEVNSPWIGAYLGALSVEPVLGTNLVKVGFSSPNPQLAARVANAHVEAFVERGIELRKQEARAAEKFLKGKLAELRSKLENSEVALNDYRREKGIIPGLMSLDGKNTLVLNRLTDLSKDLTSAQVNRIGLEAQVDLVGKKDYALLPAVRNNKLIMGLQTSLNALEVRRARLAAQFKDDYPPLAQLNAELATTRRQLDLEIRSVVDGIKAAYREAVAKERQLEAETGKQRQLSLSLNDAAVRYAILQRDVETNRELYEAVLRKMKDVGIEAEAATTNISVVDRASLPTVPSSPHKLQALVLSLLLGLGGGVGLALLLDSADNRFKDAEDAERYLRLPNLARVPDAARLGRPSYGGEKLVTPGGAPVVQSRKPLLTTHDYYSPLAEAYRDLRTALLLSQAGAPPKTVLMTSALAGEGKTVTSVNIAMMLAQLGARVLLIDADLRNPRCHEVLRAENFMGLAEALAGIKEPDELISATAVPNLSLLCAGSLPPNPAELLGSTRMRQVLHALGERYDHVVIDSSPVNLTSDSLVLSAMVDGVVMVVDSAHTHRQEVRAAGRRLGYVGARILGTVLNRVRNGGAQYYYRYYGYRPAFESENKTADRQQEDGSATSGV